MGIALLVGLIFAFFICLIGLFFVGLAIFFSHRLMEGNKIAGILLLLLGILFMFISVAVIILCLVIFFYIMVLT